MMKKMADELNGILKQIDSFYQQYQALSNDELRAVTKKIQGKLLEDVRCKEENERLLDACLPEVFAIVKETAHRFSQGAVKVTATEYDRSIAKSCEFVVIEEGKAVYQNTWNVQGIKYKWNMVHYDEQLIAGILLHRGYAAEMATGEGKTLAETLPVFLNALQHQGVHVLTTNSYLSKRDYEQMRPIYMFHGLSADCIEYYNPCTYSRIEAYKKDIVYGTNHEITFDYLHDHLTLVPYEVMQGNHHYAIIDEIDSILIDEANESHGIVGGARYDVEKEYTYSNRIVEELLSSDVAAFLEKKPNGDTISLRPEVEAWLEGKLGIEGLFSITIDELKKASAEDKQQIKHRLFVRNTIKQSLIAHLYFERDVEYIVGVELPIPMLLIVDQNTGRIKDNNRYEYGLHSAIEAKERIPISAEQTAEAAISLKNYFKLYDKISGMSGTIMAASEELNDVYGLKTATVPLHKPCLRKDEELCCFKTRQEKERAILKKIQELNELGRPVLVGCASVKESEEIAEMLKMKGLQCKLLNAKNISYEAYVVSCAGEKGAITVSTSIVGRGTDVKLPKEVLAIGGLAVVATSLFATERIERQLRGRAGRQGEPGSSYCYASLEDDVVLENIEDASFEGICDKEICMCARHLEEKKLLERRKNYAQKDDIVAPYRLEYYELRDRLLFEENYGREYLVSMVASESVLAEIDEHLGRLYNQTLHMFTNAHKAYHSYIPLPLSCNRLLLTISLCVDKVLESKNYFLDELKRQMLMIVYDTYWKKFIAELWAMPTDETSTLSKDLESMSQNICADVVEYLRSCRTPFRVQDNVEDAGVDNGNSCAYHAQRAHGKHKRRF